MAEESMDPLITPQKIDFDSAKMDVNSAEKNQGSLDNGRRYSCGKRDPANISRPRVPIHLRASTGSCHDICKYGGRHAFEETPRESLRKRIAKCSENEPSSVKSSTVSGEQKEEKVVKKKHSLLVKTSSENKTRLLNSRAPGTIKREILSSSEKVEVLVKEGGSNDSKTSRTDKKTCDRSVKRSSLVNSTLLKIKPSSSASARRNSDVQTGRKMTSSLMSPEKALKSPAARSSPKFSLGTTASSKAREDGRIKSSLSSALKYRNGRQGVETEKSNGEGSEKTLHVIKIETENNELNPKARNLGRVKSSSSMNYRNGVDKIGTKKLNGDGSEKTLHVTEKKNASYHKSRKAGGVVKSSPLNYRNGIDKIETETSNGQDCETTLLDIKTVTENNPCDAQPSSPSLLSHPEQENVDEVKNSGNEADEFVSEKTVSVETINAQSVKEIHTVNEEIKYSDNVGDKFVSDKMVSLEIGNLQSLKENHDRTPMLSSDEEIYSSSSKFSSRSKSTSLSSIGENDEEIRDGNSDSDEIVSVKTISTEIVKLKLQYPKESRKTLRKSRSVLSDDKNRTPVKLKFRRGKIIEPQPENNIPKRLKFRRARAVGNNTDDYCGNKNYTEVGNAPTSPQNRTLIRKSDDFISYNKKSVETNHVKPGTPSKGLRKSRSVVSEEKYRSPVNLIRRVKTTDLQAANNSPPVRLKFTSGRSPRPEDGKSDFRRKTIKRTGNKNDAFGFELSSRRVILKHPEVQKKKTGQVLLNNVIEETASKLVETRKSKVKALVGAFETVISLQDPKPSWH